MFWSLFRIYIMMHGPQNVKNTDLDRAQNIHRVMVYNGLSICLKPNQFGVQ
jgi:hypothetical protein